MLKALSKVFVVTALLIAFLGQAMAFIDLISHENTYKSPYQNSFVATFSLKDKKNISSNQAVDNGEAVADCGDVDCCSIDCCDTSCVCSASGCSSFMYLNNVIGAAQLIIFNETISLPETKLANSITTLPYRPPIFIS